MFLLIAVSIYLLCGLVVPEEGIFSQQVFIVEVNLTQTERKSTLLQSDQSALSIPRDIKLHLDIPLSVRRCRLRSS